MLLKAGGVLEERGRASAGSGGEQRLLRDNCYYRNECGMRADGVGVDGRFWMRFVSGEGGLPPQGFSVGAAGGLLCLRGRLQ
jgi:hypothetical protein